jgi:hypothetical protein
MLQEKMQQGQQGQQMPQQPQQGLGAMMPAQMANGGMLMASASDPMDDKNQISLQLFGKPLHELNPDEEMQLDDWLEDKAQKWQGAYGGTPGADGRRAYGLGSIFKKITKPIKKLVKSPVGKAAALAAGAYFAPTLFGGTAGFGKGSTWGNVWKGMKAKNLIGALDTKGAEFGRTLANKALSPLGIGAAATLAPFAMSAMGKWDTGAEEIDSLKNKAAEFGFDYSQMIQDIQNAVATGSEEEIAKVMTQYNLSRGDMPGSKYIGTAAEGGRIGLHEGGDPFYGEGESYWEHRYDDPKKWWGGPHMSEWFEERHSTGPEGKPHSTPKGRQSEGLFRLMEYAKEKERRDLLGRMGRPGQRGRKEIPGQDVAQGGRIGYAEGGWEAREKQDLISRLVRMGLPLPQAMKMAEMIIANATPQELQRTLRGTRSQGLTPEESINFQENITAPGVDIQEDETITDHMSKVYPLPKSVQAQPVSLSGAKPDMRAAMMGWARPSQALIDRMQRAPDEFRRRMQRAPYEVEVEEEISPYGAAEGGLMSLGGMEMDLRGGGFVPIGKVEKADDVPARLSKNEFVFTADAVRAAGNGNVDAGADKMYKTMKQLENRVGS